MRVEARLLTIYIFSSRRKLNIKAGNQVLVHLLLMKRLRGDCCLIRVLDLPRLLLMLGRRREGRQGLIVSLRSSSLAELWLLFRRLLCICMVNLTNQIIPWRLGQYFILRSKRLELIWRCSCLKLVWRCCKRAETRWKRIMVILSVWSWPCGWENL